MARKERRNKMKNHDVLEQALATVREGQTPHVNGSTELGVKDVVDPFDNRVRSKIVALRNDPLGHMHVRRSIDDVQFKAGRAYQEDWENAEIGGARAIDPAKDHVDGGKFVEADTDRRLQAHAELARIHRALGEDGSELVQLVLAHNMPLAQVAQIWGMDEQSDYRALRKEFERHLDKIAERKGLAPERPAHGPRRQRDSYDALARYSDNPTLHKAVRLAKDA